MRERTGILRSLVFFLAILVHSVLSGAPAAQAESQPDKTFDDWRTYIAPGQPVVFAMSAMDPKGSSSTLHLGKFQGQCGRTQVMIVHRFTTPAKKDFDDANISGEVRVDQMPVHSTVSRLIGKTGETSEAYYVNSFSSPQTLLEEMANGQMVRFRFKIGEQEFYYRYSLNGFQPAYARISQLCAQGGGGQEHRPAKPKPEGGPKPKAGKNDSDYFPGNAPQENNKPNKSDKDYF